MQLSMKHLFFVVCLFLCSFGRLWADGLEPVKTAVVQGRILNRGIYPNEKELELVLVSFNAKQETVYKASIREDDTFSFNVPLCEAVCEFSLRNYAPRLYLAPGDSLYLQIDFNDLLHPVVKGTSAALNQGMLAFAEGGFYQSDYVYMDDVNSSVEVFEKAVQKEYALRKQKREEFLERYRPTSDVAELTERLLLADYYAERFRYTQQRIRRLYGQKQVDWQKETAACEALMPEVDALLADKIITSAHFRLIRDLTFYLRYRRAATGDLDFTDKDLVDEQRGSKVAQFLLADLLGTSLAVNDTVAWDSVCREYDTLVQIPVLRHSLDLLYRRTTDYLRHPEVFSRCLLHGDADTPEAEQYMAPLRSLIDKHRGKVLYIDFWGVFCPPCLAEMEPLKKLCARYSTDDVAMVSLCVSGKRTDYERILQRFSLKETVLECLHWEDFAERDVLQKMSKHLGQDGIPFFLLVNKEGVIVNYGSAIRPSWPKTAVQIDQLRED